MTRHRGKIELSVEEHALLETIDFGPPSHDHDVYLANSGRAAKLMQSLINRQGIPQHRVSWFIDPDYKRGRIKGSRKSLFECNGTTGSAIFTHPLKHLHYFVFGAALPSTVNERFSEFVKRRQPIGSDDAGDLLALAKDLTNEFQIEPYEASEEFFKLALDCGVHRIWAQYLEQHIGKMKLRKPRNF
ncbi:MULTISPECIES: hypothetical protein [unclassified Bradyrhizobium]|uniref:hypothetical protein n=1 Tax=unclassified Bradyrhizobium TaxID=2631580 RepID=UPI002916B8A1|nr:MULTISPECIES: hypothetical protein [unclassified Bradyrhizobium]